VLDEFSNRGFVAVAISQPGYGASDDPPDYCGTFTQNAVIAVIEKLENEGIIKPNQIILEGISRGAIVAGLVAAKKRTIIGIILVSGVFDFIKYQEDAKTDGSKKSIINSIKEEIGNSEISLNSRSLINFAENIKANTLILNGENDEKTIPQQAQELTNEINKHGGKASFVIFKNTGHHIPIDERNKIIEPFISKTLEGIKK
jgi:dipeptidyl aminopeptidase/acylaminoacyl peptidase